MTFFNSTNTTIMVISTDCFAERQLLDHLGYNDENRKDWDYVISDGKKLKSCLNDNFSFILINQDKWNTCSEKVLKKIKETKRHFIIWIHSSSGIKCKEINYDHTLRCIDFHHLYPDAPSEIEKYMITIGKSKENDFQDIFKKESDTIIFKHIDYHSFRAEVLTPLIPLHLYLKVRDKADNNEWQNILNKCYANLKIVKENDTLNILLSLKCIAEETSNYSHEIPEHLIASIESKFENIDEIISQIKENGFENIESEQLCKDIEEFAHHLEYVISFIEFGEVANAGN